MDVAPQQILEQLHSAFGSDLRTIPVDVVKGASLAYEDAVFLTTVRLPRREILGLTFKLADRLPPLRELMCV